MKGLGKVALLLPFALGALGPASAAVAPETPSALLVTPKTITEVRRTGSGDLLLSLSISGSGLSPFWRVPDMRVTSAVDDQGYAVVPIPATHRSASSFVARDGLISRVSEVAVGQRNFTLSFSGARRSALSFKTIEGNVEVFNPSAANGALVRIPYVMSIADRVEHPALTKLGIEFHFFPDQAGYERARERFPSVSTSLIPNLPNEVGFHQQDPTGLLEGLQFQDAAGAPIPVVSAGFSGGAGIARFRAPLPKDARLILVLRVPGSVTSVPFRVEDIPLP